MQPVLPASLGHWIHHPHSARVDRTGSYVVETHRSALRATVAEADCRLHVSLLWRLSAQKSHILPTVSLQAWTRKTLRTVVNVPLPNIDCVVYEVMLLLRTRGGVPDGGPCQSPAGGSGGGATEDNGRGGPPLVDIFFLLLQPFTDSTGYEREKSAMNGLWRCRSWGGWGNLSQERKCARK